MEVGTRLVLTHSNRFAWVNRSTNEAESLCFSSCGLFETTSFSLTMPPRRVRGRTRPFWLVKFLHSWPETYMVKSAAYRSELVSQVSAATVLLYVAAYSAPRRMFNHNSVFEVRTNSINSHLDPLVVKSKTKSLDCEPITVRQ